MREIIFAYAICVNVIAFFVYGIDKLKAKWGRWRVPEVTLLLLAAAGGSIGAWLGIKVWRHKTLHRRFSYGIPLIFIIQAALCAYLLLEAYNIV